MAINDDQREDSLTLGWYVFLAGYIIVTVWLLLIWWWVT